MIVVGGAIPGRFFVSGGDWRNHDRKLVRILFSNIFDSGAMIVVGGAIPGRFFLSGGDWRNHDRKLVRILCSIQVLC